ncbi:imidazole glycerol phosphate synthase subunit HisH [Candidatus Peribacteria bacterium]|nr:imidazole glycerol phosphate synthase subunit HisH [Candidatus Peribacteria bacterium]
MLNGDSSPAVVIVDIGVGNHMSVQNALRLLQIEALISSDPSAIAKASHLILPGVGSFEEGMMGIHKRALEPLLREEVVKKKKPILGICLGMQLFASEGLEHGRHKGLHFIPGVVEKIDIGASGLRLPHIGWNDVRITGDHSIARGFDHVPAFYFVHSYHVHPEDLSIIAGECIYGQPFAAIIQSGNICGAQFHPEKSHSDGAQILKNFLAL